MYVDNFIRLAENQAVTTTAFTTNNVDLSLARDIGEGGELALVFSPTSTLTTASGTATINGQVVASKYPLYFVGKTVTINVATPAVITLQAGTHTLVTGSPIVFANSGGALPTGLTAGTTYYVINTTSTSTFQVASSEANALAGTAIATTGAGSGTHTFSQVGYLYVGDSGAMGHTELNPTGASIAVPMVAEINPRIASYGQRYLAGLIAVGNVALNGGSFTVDLVTTIQDGRKFHASGFTVL